MTVSTAAGSGVGWRSLPPTVWILVCARAVNRLGAFTLPFLAITLVREYGASVSQAGYVLAVFGMLTIPSRLIGGRLADRRGDRATIVIGLTGTAAAQLCVAGASSLAQVTFAVAILGLMFEIYEPPSQSTIADVTAADQRPIAYGLLAAAMAAAGMAAGVLAALLAGLDLRWLFVADAVSCLVCAVVVAAFLPGSPTDTARATRVNAWADARLLWMLALGILFASIYLQITIALPLTLTGRDLQPSLVGVLLTVSAATTVLGQPLLTRRRIRMLDDFRAMTVGYSILAAGLLFVGLATSAPGFIVATVVWSVGDLILLGRAYTIVAGLAPAAARGRYLAVYGTSWGIAGIGAPLVGTQLLVHAGPVVAWTAMAGLCLVLAVAQPTLRTRLRDSTGGPP